jgi:plasmid maintenance system killer protein
MVIIFENKELEVLYQGQTLRSKPKYPTEVIKRFAKTVKLLSMADSIAQIKSIKGLNFEPLKGKLKSRYSVRVNDKYRVILRKEKGELVVEEVLVIEELSNHYQ